MKKSGDPKRPESKPSTKITSPNTKANIPNRTAKSDTRTKRQSSDSQSISEKNVLAAKDARALAAQTDKKKNDTSGDNRKGHVKVLSAKKMQKKKRKKKAHKTGPKLSKKANEESFVEQVRNMWRSAVLETVGLGTDAAFLKRIV